MTKEKIAKEAICYILLWTILYFCISKWIFPHRWYAELTAIYFVSLLTFSFGQIPVGYKGDYVLRGKRRPPVWEEGFFMIPPFFPILVFINGWIVGVRKKTPPEQSRQVRSDFFERTHHDTRDVRRVVETKVSLSQNIVLGLWTTFSFSGDTGKMRFLPNLFLVLFTTFYVGNFISYNTTGRNPTADQNPQTINPQTLKRSTDESMLMVFTRLNNMPTPTFPTKENFIVEVNDKVQYYFDYEGIRYIRYMVRSGWNWRDPQVKIDETLTECMIVPAGRGIRFATNRPPRYVVNMEAWTESMLDTEKMQNKDKVLAFLLPVFYRIKIGSWRELVDKWGMIDHVNYTFSSKASEASDIPYPHLGGLVCF